MLHIKLEGNGAKSTMQAHILSLNHPRPLGWGQRGKNIFFSESCHAAYQIKGNGA